MSRAIRWLLPLFLLAAAGCSDEPCGDGTLDPDEICDEGEKNSDTAPGACRTDCKPARCGDGVVDPGEDCDGADDCNAACRFPGCGNGFVDGGEECDDGAQNSDLVPDACRTGCRRAGCGDGVVDSGEGCDDGPENSDTVPGACRTTCVPAHCGDGVLDSGETCDDGAANSDTVPGACRTTCVPAHCGDGVWDAGEGCDNGPANADDVGGACRTDCTVPVCGDGVVDPGEECDEGPENSATRPDACRILCRLPACGDGIPDTGEVCDDGNSDPDDGCTHTCVPGVPACTDHPVIHLMDPSLWIEGELEYTGTLSDPGTGSIDCTPRGNNTPDAIHAVFLPGHGTLVAEVVAVDGSFLPGVEIQRECLAGAVTCGLAPEPSSPAVVVEAGIPATSYLRWIVVETGDGNAGDYRLHLRMVPPLAEGSPCRGDGTAGTCAGDLVCIDPDGDGEGRCGPLVPPGGACDPEGLASRCIESICVGGTCVSSCGDGLVQEWEECDDGNSAAGDNCGPTCLAAGRSCESPYRLNLSPVAGGGFGWQGTTEIGSPGFTASCGETGAAPHVIGTFTAPEAGIWAFQVVPEGGDWYAALSLVTEGCGSGVELACAWAWRRSDAPTAVASLAAGETVWPLVTGTGTYWNRGPFTLAVERVVCGDGAVGIGEGCDDGNREPGDGCSETCVEEEP
jgi:cysteine-rich repeat protein